jgi:hypothetical protein
VTDHFPVVAVGVGLPDCPFVVGTVVGPVVGLVVIGPVVGWVPGGLLVVWFAVFGPAAVVAADTGCPLERPTTTQRLAAGHDTALICVRSLGPVAACQVVPPSVVISNAAPCVLMSCGPPAKHWVAVAQVIWSRVAVPAGSESRVHDVPPSLVINTSALAVVS